MMIVQNVERRGTIIITNNLLKPKPFEIYSSTKYWTVIKKCVYCNSDWREDNKGHCINCGSSSKNKSL